MNRMYNSLHVKSGTNNEATTRPQQQQCWILNLKVQLTAIPQEKVCLKLEKGNTDAEYDREREKTERQRDEHTDTQRQTHS